MQSPDILHEDSLDTCYLYHKGLCLNVRHDAAVHMCHIHRNMYFHGI